MAAGCFLPAPALQPAPAPSSGGEESLESADAPALVDPVPEARDGSRSGGSGSGGSSPVLPVGFIPSFIHERATAAAAAGGSSSGSSSSGTGAQPGSMGFFAAGAGAAGGSGGGAGPAREKRAAAVRLLVAFMGAGGGWLYSAWDFIDSAADCYQ